MTSLPWRRLGVLGLVGGLAMAIVAPNTTALGASTNSGTTLTAYKTATIHWDKTFAWTITKTVSPSSFDIFDGDTATASYDVSLTKDAGTVSAPYMDGKICVTNAGSLATSGLAITDTVTIPPSTTPVAIIPIDLSAKPILAPGETYCYSYRWDGPFVLGKTYKDTAKITILNHSNYIGKPFGPSPSASALMPLTPNLVNNTVTVSDPAMGVPVSVSASGSITYQKTFTCADAGTIPNTATIDQTGQSSSASVDLRCFHLTLAKTADTSWKRDWSWTIDKTVDQPTVSVKAGATATVTYTVALGAVNTDSAYRVTGTITVSNPAPIAASLTAVTDSFAGSNATVTCPSTAVPAGGSLECAYALDLTGPVDGTNTATATQQNYAYPAGTPTGTTNVSGTASVAFSATPTVETDECVTVVDSMTGASRSFCRGDASLSWTYAHDFGPYGTCGSTDYPNTATFTTNDSGTTGSSSASVTVTVTDCNACFRNISQGYWSQHPDDKTWELLGADAPFFGTGFTNGEAIDLANNAYPGLAQLAKQYIATELNLLAYADDGFALSADAQAAYDAATEWLEANSGHDLTATEIQQLKDWGQVLSDFIAATECP